MRDAFFSKRKAKWCYWAENSFKLRKLFPTSRSVPTSRIKSQTRTLYKTYRKFENHLTSCAVLFLLNLMSGKYIFRTDELGYLTQKNMSFAFLRCIGDSVAEWGPFIESVKRKSIRPALINNEFVNEGAEGQKVHYTVDQKDRILHLMCPTMV